MPTIAVTGASGQLGRLVAQELLERGLAPADLVLITRSPDALAELAARGARVRAGDFDDPASLGGAFAGVDRLLLISTDAVGRRAEQQRPAIEAAAAAGVGHVLYTSAPNPAEDSPASVVVADHRQTEQALKDSGLAWTVLRNALYAEFEVPGIAHAIDSGQFVANTGDAGHAYVSRPDCAAAAAGALLGDGHEGAVYDITGPALVTAADKAALASELGGKPVTPVLVDDQALTAGLVASGLPAEVAPLVVGFGAAIRERYMSQLSGDFEALAGRTPQPLREVVAAGLAAG